MAENEEQGFIIIRTRPPHSITPTFSGSEGFVYNADSIKRGVLDKFLNYSKKTHGFDTRHVDLSAITLIGRDKRKEITRQEITVILAAIAEALSASHAKRLRVAQLKLPYFCSYFQKETTKKYVTKRMPIMITTQDQFRELLSIIAHAQEVDQFATRDRKKFTHLDFSSCHLLEKSEMTGAEEAESLSTQSILETILEGVCNMKDHKHRIKTLIFPKIKKSTARDIVNPRSLQVDDTIVIESVPNTTVAGNTVKDESLFVVTTPEEFKALLLIMLQVEELGGIRIANALLNYETIARLFIELELNATEQATLLKKLTRGKDNQRIIRKVNLPELRSFIETINNYDKKNIAKLHSFKVKGNFTIETYDELADLAHLPSSVKLKGIKAKNALLCPENFIALINDTQYSTVQIINLFNHLVSDLGNAEANFKVINFTKTFGKYPFDDLGIKLKKFREDEQADMQQELDQLREYKTEIDSEVKALAENLRGLRLPNRLVDDIDEAIEEDREFNEDDVQRFIKGELQQFLVDEAFDRRYQSIKDDYQLALEQQSRIDDEIARIDQVIRDEKNVRNFAACHVLQAEIDNISLTYHKTAINTPQQTPVKSKAKGHRHYTNGRLADAKRHLLQQLDACNDENKAEKIIEHAVNFAAHDLELSEAIDLIDFALNCAELNKAQASRIITDLIQKIFAEAKITTDQLELALDLLNLAKKQYLLIDTITLSRRLAKYKSTLSPAQQAYYRPRKTLFGWPFIYHEWDVLINLSTRKKVALGVGAFALFLVLSGLLYAAIALLPLTTVLVAVALVTLVAALLTAGFIVRRIMQYKAKIHGPDVDEPQQVNISQRSLHAEPKLTQDVQYKTQTEYDHLVMQLNTAANRHSRLSGIFGFFPQANSATALREFLNEMEKEFVKNSVTDAKAKIALIKQRLSDALKKDTRFDDEFRNEVANIGILQGPEDHLPYEFQGVNSKIIVRP